METGATPVLRSARAEVGQIFRRDFIAAGLRGRGVGVMGCFTREWRRGYGVDSVSGRRRLLVRHFFSAAKTDVDLRFRPRIDARAVDVDFWRKRQAHENFVQRRPRRHHENKFFHHACAVFFSALRGRRDFDFCAR